MKKLNKKGFTLIELLAIIVILAIIMVVTIPNILDMLGSATEKEFKNSANAIEKWVSDQYTLAVVGNASSTFTAVCGKTGSSCKGTNKELHTTTTTGEGDDAVTTITMGADAKAFLKAAGQKADNYSEVIVNVDPGSNRVCVQIKPSTTGDFSGVSATDYTKSNGC